MVKSSTIDSFFKRKNAQNLEESTISPCTANDLSHEPQSSRPSKSPRVEFIEIDIASLERDPGLRRQIWKYHVDQQDEIRRAYIKAGPYEHILPVYPFSGSEKHPRRFQSSWFRMFPSWLEYSPVKDAAFCLPCFLFNKKTTGRFGASAFTVEGFRNWKKVNDGKKCAFLNHVGRDPNSPHNAYEQSCRDLMNQLQHIEKALHTQSSTQIANNRLRLKTSIDVV